MINSTFRPPPVPQHTCIIFPYSDEDGIIIMCVRRISVAYALCAPIIFRQGYTRALVRIVYIHSAIDCWFFVPWTTCTIGRHQHGHVLYAIADSAHRNRRAPPIFVPPIMYGDHINLMECCSPSSRVYIHFGWRTFQHMRIAIE